MKQTPFVYGRIADINNFTDRENESRVLYQNFTSLVNTILISPRRWGKTSLVNSVAKGLMKDNKKVKVCLMDIFNVRNENEFYVQLAQCVLKTTSSKWEEFTENAKQFLSHLLPKVTFSPDSQAEISFGIGWEELQKNPDDILNLAETIAKKKNIKIIICIDEFQSISDFENPEAFQRKLRSHWQTHQQVSYCLYGSKRHMLMDIFSNNSMPFYKFGDIMFLEKINNKIWGEFIEKRFDETKKKITTDDAEYLAGLVENHPYYVQQLAQQSWLRTAKICSKKIIDESCEGIKSQLSLLFVSLIESLTTSQINFLHAIVENETVFGSQENLKKYKLKTTANVARAKESLLSKEIIDITLQKVEIQDPFFKIWLKTDYFKIK